MTVKEDKNKIKSCLYIVSTPIGNLDDITFRAIKVLKNTNDKYTILLSYCETTNNSFMELKNYMSNIIDEINCIKNDMEKIKYFLDLISPSNKKINDLKLI